MILPAGAAPAPCHGAAASTPRILPPRLPPRLYYFFPPVACYRLLHIPPALILGGVPGRAGWLRVYFWQHIMPIGRLGWIALP